MKMGEWDWENVDTNKLIKSNSCERRLEIDMVDVKTEAEAQREDREIVCKNEVEQLFEFAYAEESSVKVQLNIGTKEVGFTKNKKVEEDTLKRKVKKTPKEKILVQHDCICCGSAFSGILELNLHMKRYRDCNQNFICPESNCNGKFSSKNTDVHMNKHNGQSITCTECGKQCFSDMTFKRHMREKAKMRKVKCEQCPQVFSSKEGLQRHIQMHDIEFPCDQCNLRFEEQFVLRRHVKLFHEQLSELLQCPLCEKRFKIKHSLQQHTRLVHNKEKNHGCTACSLKFISRYKLKRHVSRKHMIYVKYILISKCKNLLGAFCIISLFILNKSCKEKKTEIINQPKCSFSFFH